MIRVSVIVPVYNVEQYLLQCLESLARQTLQEIEVICVDDGSTDASGKILDEFANRRPRFRVIHKENTGYGHSMNVGIQVAQGEYIGIVESDDYIEDTMFDTLYQVATISRAEIAKCNFFMKSENGDHYTEVLAGCPYKQCFSPREDFPILFRCTPSIWSAIYQRVFLEQNRIRFTETPGASYQDVAFFFKTIACANRVCLIPDALIHYRVDNPGSSVKSTGKAHAIFDEFDEVRQFLSGRDELRNPCQFYIAPCKYDHYAGNFHRIHDKYKLDFLKWTIQDFQLDEEAGILQEHYWASNKWSRIQNLLQDPNSFVCAAMAEVEQNRTLRAGFLTRIKEGTGLLYLYGAGRVAQSLLEFLSKNNIMVRGLLVSSKEENADSIEGIPVFEYKSSPVNIEADRILLAVKDETQTKLFEILRNDGYAHIILFPWKIRNSLYID